MFFKVVLLTMLNVIALAVPPLLLLTIPLTVAQCGLGTRKAARLNRQRRVFLEYQEDQERMRLLRRL